MQPDQPQTPAPEPPAEAVLLRLAREATGMTADAAAKAAGMVSAAYWRDVERGYGGRRGKRATARASDRYLAHMARAVGLPPERLAEAGRVGAARVLEEILHRELPPAPRPEVTPDVERAIAPLVIVIKARLEAARGDGREGVPAGERVFPDSARNSRSWDMAVARAAADGLPPGEAVRFATRVLAILWFTEAGGAAAGESAGG